jgi:hypothetical protein
MSRPRRVRQRSRASRSRRTRLASALLVVSAGLALSLLSFWLWYGASEPSFADAGSDYNPADVVRDQGLHGTHVMGASQTPVPFVPTSGPQPKLTIPHEKWSFGTVGPTDVVDHTFVLRNDGEAPLTIRRIYTTCGCTTAELSAKVIPPGKVALLRLIFDAGYHDTRGQYVRRGVVIENNDPTRRKVTVWADAIVRTH